MAQAILDPVRRADIIGPLRPDAFRTTALSQLDYRVLRTAAAAHGCPEARRSYVPAVSSTGTLAPAAGLRRLRKRQ